MLFTTLLLSVHLLPAQIGDLDLGKALAKGNDVYGSYCGFAGTHPEARQEVEKLIKHKDIETLSSWLSGPNLVRQTYAAEAFMRLGSKMNIDQEILDQVEVIKRKKDIIPTCMGCFLQDLSIEELLSDIDVDVRYDLNDGPDDASPKY